MPAYDAVLLIASGGPERMEDVRPFLANVLRDRPAPPEGIEAIVRRYELIGGRSPLTELTTRQAAALQALLASRGPALPVSVAMRHWHPHLADALAAMRAAGVRRAIGVVLATPQHVADRGRDQRALADAGAALGGAAPAVDLAPDWHAHPLFVDAIADRARHALAALPPARRHGVQLVFAAPGISMAAAAVSPYEGQLRVAAALVAEQLGFSDHRLAYQGRDGDPRGPWLEPDFADVVREEAARRTRELLVVPIGFACDDVEVLCGLDIEARRLAEAAGIGLTRAGTVGDHPGFIRMLAAVVAARAAA